MSWTPSHTEEFLNGNLPNCIHCSAHKVTSKGRILKSKECCKLRPNVILYNEPHPWGLEYEAHFQHSLNQKPDPLLVVGTSLSLPSLNSWIKTLSWKRSTCIYINIDQPPCSIENYFTHFIKSDCDVVFGPILDLLTGDFVATTGVRRKRPRRQITSKNKRCRNLFKHE